MTESYCARVGDHVAAADERGSQDSVTIEARAILELVAEVERLKSQIGALQKHTANLDARTIGDIVIG